MLRRNIAFLVIAGLNAASFGAVIIDTKSETLVGKAKRGNPPTDVADTKTNTSIQAGPALMSVFAYNGVGTPGGDEVVAQGSSSSALSLVSDGFDLLTTSSLNPAVFAQVGAANVEYGNVFRFHITSTNANVSLTASVTGAHNPATDLTSNFPGWDQVFSLQLNQYAANFTGSPTALYTESRPLGGTFTGKSASLAAGYYEAIVRFEEITNGFSGFPPVSASFALSAHVPEPVSLMAGALVLAGASVRRRPTTHR